jgi:hypothetical protein
MVKYIFRDGPLTIPNAKKASAQKIGTALAQIAEQQKGRLTPPAVVEAARSNRHPLHQYFEWDNDVAAEAYRLDQARTLIRSVAVVDDNEDSKPAYLSISDKAGTSYRAVEEVLDSAELQSAVLAAAERDLIAFEKRYRQLQDICEIISSARSKIAARRNKHESRLAS